MPALHVVAAGSLLEFALADHSFSMPVGRIEYLFLDPMTFGEFLCASGRDLARPRRTRTPRIAAIMPRFAESGIRLTKNGVDLPLRVC